MLVWCIPRGAAVSGCRQLALQLLLEGLRGLAEAPRLVQRAEEFDVPLVGVIGGSAVEAGCLQAAAVSAMARPGGAGPFAVPARRIDALVAFWLVVLPVSYVGEAPAVKLVLPPCPVGPEPLRPQLLARSYRAEPGPGRGGDAAYRGDPR